MNVAILGAGMMGTAIATPIADRGHAVRLVGTPLDGAQVDAMRRTGEHPGLGARLPEAVLPELAPSVADAIGAADAIVLGVSSAGIGWAADVLARHLSRPVPIAMVTKGLQHDGALRILPDVLGSRLPEAVRAAPVAIGGPCIAGELARRRPSAVVFAGRDPRACRRLADAFRGPCYRVATSDDPAGVCTSSALKNAYATAVGIGAGLHELEGGIPGSVAMHNFEAAVFAQALVEMTRLAVVLGGRPETAAGLAGAGDLFVTCQGGRSSRLGRLLGLGRSLADAQREMSTPDCPVTLEGVEIAAVVVRDLPPALAPEDLPLLHRLHAVLFEGAAPASVFECP
ncbi:MAG: glycerol-3-phosphate dehydrogenase [Deltaproteobacteria bacterium]|nr:glycerol-3-phosphate dehydrogenase [Deltaproteobacteria bacterium]